MINTLEYYNKNIESFVHDTRNVEFTDMQDKFLECLKKKHKDLQHLKVLDFGCGSGRDTKYFLEQGMDVAALDGSEAMVKAVGEYTGIKVLHMDFRDFSAVEEYDGIWACASLLHLKKSELPGMFMQLGRAMKKSGILYASFKYGDFEGVKNGRYFSYLREKELEEIIASAELFSVKESWLTSDVRPGRQEEKWINIIAEKI